MASTESADDSQQRLLANLEVEDDDDICTIVGVGASAGGLEAFTQLLKHLPTDTRMAFVLIQHLAPTHPSLLTPLLAKVTAMPVVEIEDGMSVRANRVYVIPPNCDLVLVGNRLQLSVREKIHGKYLPVDRFLESLATERQHRAIAVVLSGTDSDGAIGIAAVKAAGGITFAQDIASSKFEGMPDRAIATGQVDFVLPPAEIATEIAKIAQHFYVARLPPVLPEIEASSANEASVLATIFTLLNRHKGVDFTGYKPATLKRRILRRMALHNFERWDDYSQYLGTHPIELDALERDLLINVTSFFRDPVTFDRLTTTVLPTILARKSLGVAVRIWVAGCSTGEEAYSIGICLLEYLAERDLQLPIQIFATDISESAIDRALAKVKPMMPIDDDNRTDLDLNQAADRLVLDRYAPVGVTIDADMNIVQFRGQTGNYFEPAAGKPSFNLFKMVKPELVVELRAAIHQAKQQQEIVRQEGLRLSTATGVKTIDLEVIPFQVGASERPYLLVLFQESAIVISDASSQLTTPRAKKGKQTLIEQEQARLQQELATTREYLQAIMALHYLVCQVNE